MVSVVRSFVKSLAVSALFVSAFAVSPVLAAGAAKGEAQSAVAAENAELIAELAVRDSVMALHDSACTVEKKALRSESALLMWAVWAQFTLFATASLIWAEFICSIQKRENTTNLTSKNISLRAMPLP